MFFRGLSEISMDPSARQKERRRMAKIYELLKAANAYNVLPLSSPFINRNTGYCSIIFQWSYETTAEMKATY